MHWQAKLNLFAQKNFFGLPMVVVAMLILKTCPCYSVFKIVFASFKFHHFLTAFVLASSCIVVTSSKTFFHVNLKTFWHSFNILLQPTQNESCLFLISVFQTGTWFLPSMWGLDTEDLQLQVIWNWTKRCQITILLQSCVLKNLPWMLAFAWQVLQIISSCR